MDGLCFDCGQPAAHEHHVVPKSLGGTATVPVCLECHAKVHDRQTMTHSGLIKAGIRRARENGVRIGRKKGVGKGVRVKVTTEQEGVIRRMKGEGAKVASIARETGLSRPTVYSVLGSGSSKSY